MNAPSLLQHGTALASLHGRLSRFRRRCACKTPIVFTCACPLAHPSKCIRGVTQALYHPVPSHFQPGPWSPKNYLGENSFSWECTGMRCEGGKCVFAGYRVFRVRSPSLMWVMLAPVYAPHMCMGAAARMAADSAAAPTAGSYILTQTTRSCPGRIPS